MVSSRFPLIPGDESKIVELSNGDWLVNSRLNSKGYRYSHISNDKGLSWSSFKNNELLDPGCNAGLINYPLNYKNKNALLFSNAFSSKDRVNLSLSVSFDEGKNWEKSKTVYKGDSAYSSLTILKNGDIGLISWTRIIEDEIFIEQFKSIVENKKCIN